MTDPLFIHATDRTEKVTCSVCAAKADTQALRGRVPAAQVTLLYTRFVDAGSPPSQHCPRIVATDSILTDDLHAKAR